MPHCRMTIDGRTELDEEVTPGQKKPPAVLADLIRPGGKKQPYMMAAASALAEAVMAGNSVDITIDTRPDGWDLSVTHKHRLASVRNIREDHNGSTP